MCVCVFVFGCVPLHTQINHKPSSFWSVISTGGAERAAPRVLQGPLPSQSSCLPPLLVGLAALWPCPPGGSPARLSCAGTGRREEEKEKGREGRRKGGREEGKKKEDSKPPTPS